MGKRAQEYIRSRQANLPRSIHRTTELQGVDYDVQKEHIRTQEIADERTLRTNRGLVPVTLAFHRLATQCDVPTETITVNHNGETVVGWVPAWYKAAYNTYWVSYRIDADIAGIATETYRQFIRELSSNKREQFLLVGEMLLSYPYQDDETARGFRAWIALHGAENE